MNQVREVFNKSNSTEKEQRIMEFGKVYLIHLSIRSMRSNIMTVTFCVMYLPHKRSITFNQEARQITTCFYNCCIHMHVENA